MNERFIVMVERVGGIGLLTWAANWECNHSLETAILGAVLVWLSVAGHRVSAA